MRKATKSVIKDKGSHVIFSALLAQLRGGEEVEFASVDINTQPSKVVRGRQLKCEGGGRREKHGRWWMDG